MTTLRYGELFAGAGGLSLGLERAGLECAWHAEWDDAPRAVLKHRWPDVPLYGDVTALDGVELVTRHGPIDLLTGGSPCQDLSVSGKRAGLVGARSSLFHHQVRLWQETNADLCLWENVYGALSSNSGADFAAVLGAFVGAAVPVPSDGWRSAGVVAGPTGVAAWRCLDCQWFGPPQRRLRVFVLGTRTGSVDPAEVLLEPEGVRGNPPSRGEKGQGATSGAREGVAVPLLEVGKRTGKSTDDPRAGSGIGEPGAPMFTLQAGAQHGIAFAENSRGELRASDVDTSLAAGGGKPGQGYPAVLAFHHTQDPINGPSAPCLGAEGMGVLAFHMKGDAGDVSAERSPSLRANADSYGGSPPAVCVTGTVTHSLMSEADASEDGTGRGTPIVARYQRSDQYEADNVEPTLSARDSRGPQDLVVTGALTAPCGQSQSSQEAAQGFLLPTAGIPRRLTPRECERLQGWPDDWTRWGVRENGERYELSDARRYKAIGNGVASPVVQWIAGRLLQYLNSSAP